jgi:hypothetical protein
VEQAVKMPPRPGRVTAAAGWKSIVPRLVCVAIAAALLTTCATSAPTSRSGRVVMSQYNRWTIRIAPSMTDRWRARVQVWPPEVTPETNGGINLHFTESASTETAIVQAATAKARSYIDASRSTQ